jgi:hypothetical protein
MHVATTTLPPFPLTLADQLDAMLSGWLERHAGSQPPSRPDATGCAVITVLPDRVAELEAFCARWDMTVRRNGATAGPWTVLIVQGRALPVRGLAEITGMYRRA